MCGLKGLGVITALTATLTLDPTKWGALYNWFKCGFSLQSWLISLTKHLELAGVLSYLETWLFG